ncbi:hypothetical protein Glove_134g145 [Diversispora epigaea]|uniref:Uncharacterized protein n=1 Tax=Diversispora epigaea TaxID=1348612 RepID=A0A397IX86_9GLOM|nr:hypothetical protein Glove_134g145 [Diversispora epigaea]
MHKLLVFGIWDLGFRQKILIIIWDLGFGIWDFGIWDFGIWILNLGGRYTWILQNIEKIVENREKLQYYWAHQVHKTYLNAQFNANLLLLDEKGAIIIVDYKMKILPKSAREVKSDFFGKSGWTLHSMLVYTKKNDNLEICAFDHWSSDTVQDAWFTSSAFEAVFNNLGEKPLWIKIISDNGAHYYCAYTCTQNYFGVLKLQFWGKKSK